MPTYQYRCADCGEERDVVQTFSDDALTVCPVCEGRFRKVFAAVGVVFKGSGFYRNDSRSTAKASENGSGSSESSEATKGSESKAKTDGGGSSSSDGSGKSDGGSSKSDSGSGKSNGASKSSNAGTKQASTT